MAWFTRLANTFRQDKIRSEIEEELANHIEAHVAHSMARGMGQEEARQDANRRFGSAVTAMEESRESDILIWLDTVLQDLRYGIRSLWKSPGVSAVAVLSLTLAMGASTAIFSVVNAVLLKTLPYRDPDRIS
ncbi:MAG TPA: permease prefix domain 1-containing protein, partial [Bryobacteraceae bacterium]